MLIKILKSYNMWEDDVCKKTWIRKMFTCAK